MNTPSSLRTAPSVHHWIVRPRQCKIHAPCKHIGHTVMNSSLGSFNSWLAVFVQKGTSESVNGDGELTNHMYKLSISSSSYYDWLVVGPAL